MSWASPDSWLTRLFSGDPVVIVLALLVTFGLPLLVHLYFYSQSARAKVTPTFLLLGPSGSGKTSLISLVGPILPVPTVRSLNSASSYKSERRIQKTKKPMRPLLVYPKYPRPSAYCFRPPSR